MENFAKYFLIAVISTTCFYLIMYGVFEINHSFQRKIIGSLFIGIVITIAVFISFKFPKKENL